MTTDAQRETATIYQFPVGGRRGLAQSRPGFDGARRSGPERSQELAPNISFGSSWYHDEAVREERNHKN